MDMLSTASALASVLGLLGLWKSERRSSEQATLDQFIDWLRRHEHHQVVDAILHSEEVTLSLKGVLAHQHVEVMDILRRLDDALSMIAYQVSAIRPLAMAVRPGARISDQAFGFLRQITESRSCRVIEIKAIGEAVYQLDDDTATRIRVDEQRFLEDDLRTLCDLGLLVRMENTNGQRVFLLTRTGANLVKCHSR